MGGRHLPPPPPLVRPRVNTTKKNTSTLFRQSFFRWDEGAGVGGVVGRDRLRWIFVDLINSLSGII